MEENTGDKVEAIRRLLHSGGIVKQPINLS